MGVSGAVANNHIYISGQNFSSPGTPWVAMCVDPNQQHTVWAENLNPSSNNFPIMNTYSSLMSKSVVITGNNGNVWLVNGTSFSMWTNFGWGQQGTFDPSLQEFWGLTPTYLYRQSLMRITYTSILNAYNVVCLAMSTTRQLVYGIAQAADATIIYAYDAYFGTWSFVGCVASMIPVPFSTAVVDRSESYLTFIAQSGSKINLVTFDLTNTVVIATVPSPDPSILFLQQV
jgi:hypothetical protein